MGSIIGNRIRDRRDGREIIYTPSHDLKAALQRHDWTWDHLGVVQRRQATSKWFKAVVDDLCTHSSKRTWESVLNDWLSEPLTFTPEAAPIVVPEPIPPKVNQSVSESLSDFRCHEFKVRIEQGFPRAITQSLRTRLFTDFENDTLYLDVNRKQPNKALKEAQNLLMGDFDGLKQLRYRLQDMGDSIRFSKHWSDFLGSNQISDWSQVTSPIFADFPQWRRQNRFRGEVGKPISSSEIRKEVAWFKSAVRYLIALEVVSPKVSTYFDFVRVQSSKTKDTEIYKPLSLVEIKSLLETLKSKSTNTPESKQNYYTTLALLCSGCRPNEVGKITVSMGQAIISGTKSKNASRSIPLSRTLQKVIESGCLNGLEGVRVDCRLRQFIHRAGFPDIYPYRFRHTVATLLVAMGDESSSTIAYRLGHHSSTFTERTYVTLHAFLGAGVTRENLRVFWKWLTEEYFM